jgi:hypothetical protein
VVLRYGAFNLRPGDVGGSLRGHQEFFGWHLEFLCKKESGSYGTYQGGRFPFDCRNVDIYVLSTGIRWEHPSFTGRAIPLPGFVSTLAAIGGDNNTDTVGTGTEAALLAAGDVWGIAKRATIYGAKVVSASGLVSDADVAAAVSSIITNRASRGRPSIVILPHFRIPTQQVPTVSARISPLENSLRLLTNLKIPVFVPAGDGLWSLSDAAYISSLNAQWVSPARMSEVFTVGALNRKEKLANFTCYGDSVNLYAPGENIITESWDGVGTVSRSGTLYATSLAVGCCAQYLHQFPENNSDDYKEFYQKYYKKNIVQDYPRSSFIQDLAILIDADSNNNLSYRYEDYAPVVYGDLVRNPTYCAYSFFVKGYLYFQTGVNLGFAQQDTEFEFDINAYSQDGYGVQRRVVYLAQTPLPNGLHLGFRTGKIYGKINRDVPLGEYYFTIKVSDGTYTENKEFFFIIQAKDIPLTAVAGKVFLAKENWVTLDVPRKIVINTLLSIPKIHSNAKAKFPEKRKIVILNKETGSLVGETYSDKQTGEFFYPVYPGTYQLVMKSPNNENSKVIDQVVS